MLEDGAAGPDAVLDAFLPDLVDILDALDGNGIADGTDLLADWLDDAGQPDWVEVSDLGSDLDVAFPGDWVVPPVSACVPTASACAESGAVDGVFASYRKDQYFPDSLYNEYTDAPVDGGRFHIAARAQAAGAIVSVEINGQNVNQMLVEPLMEWYHVWPPQLTVGEPVWFQFHSRSNSWDSASTGHIKIVTDQGVALDADFPVKKTVVPLTYITTTDNYSSFLIYVKNLDVKSQTVSRIIVNGRDVTGSGVACMPYSTLLAGETAVWRVPLCTPTVPGAPFTIVVEYEQAETAVGVGRVVKEFFPIEAWGNSEECGWPGGNQEEFDRLQNAYIDTNFLRWDFEDTCNIDVPEMINNVMPSLPHSHAMFADGFADNAANPPKITNTTAIAGFMTGDESDGEIYAENGVPNAWNKAQASNQLWNLFPEVPTYNGAKTNGHVGIFAGMADIQGMDLYAAACAPHITQWGVHPPLRAPYDYLLNARNNHMPLPTWLYAQGLSPIWNKSALFGGKIHVQPDPQEILTQALMVMAAGGKGLMWFQVNAQEAEYKPARWDAIRLASRMFRGVRHYLREGDITGLATSDATTIVEALRSPEAIVVPIIGTKTTSAPTDISCGAALITEALVPHWKMATTQPQVTVTIPRDFGVVDIFEVVDGDVVDISFGVVVTGRTVKLFAVPLSNDVPVRLVVFAMSEGVRASVKAAMQQ